jgi:hypothetical protein
MDLSKKVSSDEVWAYVTDLFNKVIPSFEKTQEGEELSYKNRSDLQNLLKFADTLEMICMDESAYKVATDWQRLKRVARKEVDIDEINFVPCMQDLGNLLQRFKERIPLYLLMQTQDTLKYMVDYLHNKNTFENEDDGNEVA